MLMAIIAGRLGRDAELKKTKNDKSVCSFSVACEIGWGDAKKTEWVKVALFGKRADGLAPYLKKGTAITVSGEGKANAWLKDGEAKGEIEIIADKITLQGNKHGSNESQPASAGSSPDDISDNSEGDDVPF